MFGCGDAEEEVGFTWIGIINAIAKAHGVGEEDDAAMAAGVENAILDLAKAIAKDGIG